MIIVSQDKLKISENMEIGVYPEYSIKNPDKIDCYKIENDSIILGEYKTEERAKEVLQEIINKYRGTESFKASVNKISDEVGAIAMKRCFVYEMPED